MQDSVAGNKRIRTLLIDNYDSYTYNLYQLIKSITTVQLGGSSHGGDNSEINNIEVNIDVITNDQVPWSDVEDLLNTYDNVVISPGPGIPEKDEGTYTPTHHSVVNSQKPSLLRRLAKNR